MKFPYKVPVHILTKKNHVYVVCSYCHYIMQEGEKDEIFIMHPKNCPCCNSPLDFDYYETKKSSASKVKKKP